MAQEQRRSAGQPERRPRTGSRRSPPEKAAVWSFALLYVVFVIGVSALLACVGWIAANDVLALNKPEKTVTVTISSEDSFGDVADMLKENGLIEYKCLFRLFAAFTGGDDVVPGTFTLNTDMDYRALLTGMSANSATKATISVTIPEGYTIDQIFALLAERGWPAWRTCRRWPPTTTTPSPSSRTSPWGTTTGWRAILYPDTYEFYHPGEPPVRHQQDAGAL